MAAVDVYLAVWCTRVVDIARSVAAHRTVNSEFFAYFKKIFTFAFILFFLAQRAAGVLNNAGAFLDRFHGKKPQAGRGAFYF